jgi:hypothetical protein
LGLVLAGTADAQRRRGLVDITPSGERHGFWLNLGFARGDEQYKFAGDPDWTEGPAKPTFSLRLGGTVNPNFRLGGEVIGWTNRTVVDGESATEYLAGLLLIGQFYPSRRAGLFVKGGAGFSRSGVSVYGPGDSSEDGFAWTVGAGYEIRLSRSLFLTPTVDLMQHRSDGSVIDGVREPALYERLVSVGVALTIQPGR